MTHPQKILITDVCAISCRLILKLLQTTPHNIIALVKDRDAFEAERFLQILDKEPGKPAYESARLELIPGDVRRDGMNINVDRQRNLADSLDVIVHTASRNSLTISASEYDDVNRIGTANALEFAGHCFSRGPLKRFVHLSSAFVSGARPDQIAGEDDLQGAPVHLNNFERSKYEAERLVRAAMHAGLPVTVLRPSMVVAEPPGPCEIAPNPIETVFAAAYGCVPVARLPIDPLARVHFVPVDFIVDAILRAMKADWAAGLTFHLTAESPPSAAQVFQGPEMVPDGMECPLLFAPEDFGVLSCSASERKILDACGRYFPYFNSRFVFETANTKRLFPLLAGSFEYKTILSGIQSRVALTNGLKSTTSNQVAA